jgi:hypothetical protein
MTRDKHLAWCKARALEYVKAGDLDQAVKSMGSDLDKHPELECNPYLLLVGEKDAANGDARAVKLWIEGFR